MIEINNLKKSFAKIDILKEVSLTLLTGERIALLGQNGSGKTTLLRCLLGLYQFQGEIEIFGINILKERERALEKMAFVPQHPPSLKNTVKEMLSLNSHLSGFSKREVYDISKNLGLDLNTCLHTPFKRLSGGMKQKLLIAIALARRPSILIMDEPSASLDSKARNAFFKLLSELPKETTLLLTSHRINELRGIVTRVIEMDQGNILLDNYPEITKESL